MATIYSHPALQALVQEQVPASPTLTNPDMILPYNTSSSPNSYRQSPPYMSLGPPSPPKLTSASGMSSKRKASDNDPVNALSYGLYEHGAPLSDIGEEETASRYGGAQSGRSTPVASSTATSIADSTPWQEDSHGSDGSGSTISARSASRQRTSFGSHNIIEDEQGGGIVKHGNDQTLEVPEFDSKRSSFSSIGGDENGLSERAERILANAKKRLTALEGNLSRARSSFILSPAKDNSFGEHHQAGGLYRSISQGGERRYGSLGASRGRSSMLGSQATSQGHMRISSETALPPQNGHVRRGEQRSASAMDSNYANSIDNVLHNTSTPPVNGGSTKRSPPQPLDVVREDENTPTPISSSPHGLGISHASTAENNNTLRQSRVDDPDASTPSRSASRASARDLNQQMNDLKSKISNLRIQTKADNLRRRSLQNLRNPSPFNAAEQWYAGAPEYRSDSSPLSQNAGRAYVTNPGQEASPTHMQNGPATSSPPMAERTRQKLPLEQDFRTPNNMYDDENTRSPANKLPAVAEAAESTYDDALELPDDDNDDSMPATEEEQVYLNEALEESLHEEDVFDHDIPNPDTQEPERHEDRADAFDYEHFILHSALGSYSKTTRDIAAINRRSMDSGGSDETTRVYAEPDPEYIDEAGGGSESAADSTPKLRPVQDRPTISGHARSTSIDSVSTMATFATATEGNVSENGEDDMPEDIMNWSGNDHSNQVRSTSTNTFAVESAKSGALPTPPTMSPRDTVNGYAVSVSVSMDTLMESLIAFADMQGSKQIRDPPTAHLDTVDRSLLESLLQSLGAFCLEMTEQSSPSRSPKKYDRKLWRRRLDAARMVLDGEVDIDPA